MTEPYTPLHLFEGFGVEMEYMIVDRDSLRVMPITDQLIFDEVGAYVSDVEKGEIAWSNELVLHVVELKTNGPAKSLNGLAEKFQEQVQKINGMLTKYNAMLLPTGAHPLMNPHTDTKLWPHEHNAVYEAYNRIFDCRGHGWANLQSTHLNLPFANDEEFGALHAAIRVLLPLMPALSASSPILEGQVTAYEDMRLEVYRHNQDKIPSIAGHIVPEAVFTQADYEQQVFARIFNDIAPFDPEGVLQDEFLNSRGAIARFSRNAIEIRLLDIQECPAADVAILQGIVAVLKALVAERWVPLAHLKQFGEKELADTLLQVIQQGQETPISDKRYLQCFGLPATAPVTAGQVWMHLLQQLDAGEVDTASTAILQNILTKGNLSKRIKQALTSNTTETGIRAVYKGIAASLHTGKLFTP